jgi:hypothetical protein
MKAVINRKMDLVSTDGNLKVRLPKNAEVNLTVGKMVDETVVHYYTHAMVFNTMGFSETFIVPNDSFTPINN